MRVLGMESRESLENMRQLHVDMLTGPQQRVPDNAKSFLCTSLISQI